MSSNIESFGKYLLLERLASGGMAEVYLAKSFGAGGIGKFVAIKRILPQFTDNQEFVDMFKEEAKLVMNLNHSNIVSIYDFGIEKSQFFLVMEFVEGQNLRQVLTFMKKQSKYFSLDQIVYCVREVAAGLDHAHRCMDASTGKQLNITHRDMSPQNVMLSFEGEVKVVDFGIAKAETQLEHTRSGTIKGKFGYMSPEQAEGQLVDARTDIFSLGIVLWELLAQDRLFSAQNEAATLRKIKDCLIPPIRKLNPAVDIELEKIVAKCLVRDRSQRYQTAEDLAKDLTKFLNMRYPDFSKQEFSKFLKGLFQDMYVENRRKLAEYAKVEHQPGNDRQDRTVVTSTQADSTAGGDNGSGSNFQVDPNHSVKIDISKLKMDTTGGNGNPMSKSAILRRSTTNTQTRVPFPGVNSNTSVSQHSGVRRMPQEPKKASGGFGFVFFLLAACAGGGYWYMQNHHKNDNQNYNQDNQVSEEPKGTITKASTSPTDTTFAIETEPSGAAVYVDDNLIGTTPVLSHISVGRTFRLKVIRDGFLQADSLAETATAEGYHKKITLMAEPPSGTLTIDAFNAGENPVVYVGDQIVSRALPAVVKIPAGSQMMVRVVSPLKKIEGSEFVVVGQGQKKSVRIILNREATLPQ